MKVRLVALFLGLLVLPLGLALWLGVRSVQDGEASAVTQARTVWSGPLNELRSRVTFVFQSIEERLRLASADDPLVRTVFTIQGDDVVSPRRYRADGSPEPFFARTEGLWEQKFWQRSPAEGAAAPTAGWKVEGEEFLYWFRDGREVRGVEADTWALLSRLSAELPELKWSPDEGAVRALVFRDAAGRTFQQWGRWNPGDAPPVLSLPLVAPLEGWEFRLYLAPEALGASGIQWALLFTLVGIGLAGVLAMGAWVFVRELGASLAEASQRVRFVNQVSHELKTPLTNILLYGELLEGELGPQLPVKPREYLEVIRGESGRLGRLITNVLTFAKKDRPDAPRLRPLVWDDAVEGACKPFRPGLADRGLVLVWRAGAPVAGQWDPDWVGQIVGNLVSNAEKYAASGGEVEVSTGTAAGQVWVKVADRGPGIPPGAAEKIFQPFARLDNRLTAEAAGTGLGLGIARDLAVRHGGSLTLEPRETGACFVFTLPWEAP